MAEQLKATIQVDIGKWIGVQRAGGDPQQLTIETLHEALGGVPGIAGTYWRAGVIDIGGSRYLPFYPGQNAPFGTVFIECMLVLTPGGLGND